MKMPEETVQQEIAEHLSKALMESAQAEGLVIALAMKDGTSWTFTSGSLATRLGLIDILAYKKEEIWKDSESMEEDDE